MKYIIIILLSILSLSVFGQSDSLPKGNPSPKGNSRAQYAYLQADSGSIQAKRDTLWQPRFLGTQVLWYNTGIDTAIWTYIGAAVGPKWVKIGFTGTSGAESTLPGGPFTTSNVQVGFDPGTNLTGVQTLLKIFYGLKPPTADLSGGTTLEYTNLSTITRTLDWEAGRQSNTATLSSIVVAGVTQSFVQPTQGATVSGTQAVEVPANTNTTYTNLVTASDGQTASATTQFVFQPRKYWGWISDTTGIAVGNQDAVILALTSALSNSKTLSVNTGAPSGTQFFVYAYLNTLGTINSITFNGIPADEAMTTVESTITTTNGFTGIYKIIYNKQGQTVSSDVIFQ